MPKSIVKNFTITRVSYSLVKVEEYTPEFVPQRDAIFSGEVSPERVKKLLKDKHGKDAIIVITKTESGRYRFVMDWHDFVRYATVDNSAAVEETEDEEDEEIEETEEVDDIGTEEIANDILDEIGEEIMFWGME